MQSSGEILSRERESLSYRSSCPTNAGHPVFQRLLGKRSGVSRYWIVRSSRTMTAENLHAWLPIASRGLSSGCAFARTRWLAMTGRAKLERLSET
jgi:hypothetical protein